MIFDTHTHYDDERYDDDRREVLMRSYQNGVKYIVAASADMESSAGSISLSRQYDFVYATVGVHPHNVENLKDFDLEVLSDLAKNNKVVAVGETGLDYYYENSPRELQKKWFARQINLAIELNLPIIIHDRDAHEDVMNIVKSENAKKVGGVFHCYSGSVEMARDVLNNNFYIAVGGTLTFKNARKLLDVVKFVPDDKLVIETDCPYLSPEPFRGKRNESSYLKYVVEKIAAIKCKSIAEIEAITTQNAVKLFNIK